MQARWLRLTGRDSRTPTTKKQKLSKRALRNDRCPGRASRRAAVTSLPIRTPIRSQTNRKFYGPVSLLPGSCSASAPSRVAEVTGRARRIVKQRSAAGDRLCVETRPASANLAETAAFQDDA